MSSLINNTDRPITSATNHIVPANSELVVTDDVYGQLKKQPYMQARAAMGEIIFVDDCAPILTRSALRNMDQGELMNVLEMHDVPDHEIANVLAAADDELDALRSLAEAVLFVDL